MNTTAASPSQRRMRRHESSRRLMRDHTDGGDLYPVFVLDGKPARRKFSMPGVERMTVDRLLPVASAAWTGIPALALFLIDPAEDRRARRFNAKGSAASAASRLLFRSMTDVALDPYTSRPDGASTRLHLNDVTRHPGRSARAGGGGRRYRGAVGMMDAHR
jgi:delta-aminolevulinic acid dehydratase/porphobilinogen synthase